MSLITCTRLDSGVARLTLDTGRGNPLTPDVFTALHTELTALAADPPRALLLDAAAGSIFSGGFALPIIAYYDRGQLESFFATYTASLDLIMRMPCPSICAVGGHCVAAGFILSLATDFRVVSSGSVKLGLPEVDLGVPVPGGAQTLLAARVGLQHAQRLGTTGAMMGPDEALRTGYADELAEDATARGLALAEALAAKPGSGACISRTFLTLDIADRVKAADERWNDTFLDGWFSEPAQAAIRAQADRLSGKGR